MKITNRQARRFLLYKQGLLGANKYIGKDGALAFVRQAGCIQFDPVDVCGKNPELVLHARVKNFRKSMLYDLLYTDRLLVDHFDKQLSIFPIADWPYFHGNRSGGWGERGNDEINAVKDEIKQIIAERGAVSSQDIGFDEKIDWYWAPTKLSRAALERMYFQGELVVHHKKGTNKYYDLIERHFPAELLNTENPLENRFDYLKWNIYRRIGSVGLLRNKPSDAFLGIRDMKAPERSEVFEALLFEGKIAEIEIEGSAEKFYLQSGDLPLLHEIIADIPLTDRCEFIAPLDNLMWDRKLTKALFGFDYTWEIYTPEAKRKYGYYTLPILFGDKFAGRVELICRRKESVLEVKNIWLEDKVKMTKRLSAAIDKALRRFMKFSEMQKLERNDG